MGKFNFKQEDFKRVKEEAEKLYANLQPVHCPYLRDKIVFNAKGIRHLKFKSDQRARPLQDQYARLKLLKLAPEVLSLSRTVQGIWATQLFEREKTNSRWENKLKNVTFYEFVAVLQNVRLKVIVKEADGGERYFWSVIPFWGIDKKTSRRTLHSPRLDD